VECVVDASAGVGRGGAAFELKFFVFWGEVLFNDVANGDAKARKLGLRLLMCNNTTRCAAHATTCTEAAAEFAPRPTARRLRRSCRTV